MNSNKLNDKIDELEIFTYELKEEIDRIPDENAVRNLQTTLSDLGSAINGLIGYLHYLWEEENENS